MEGRAVMAIHHCCPIRWPRWRPRPEMGIELKGLTGNSVSRWRRELTAFRPHQKKRPIARRERGAPGTLRGAGLLRRPPIEAMQLWLRFMLTQPRSQYAAVRDLFRWMSSSST